MVVSISLSTRVELNHLICNNLYTLAVVLKLLQPWLTSWVFFSPDIKKLAPSEILLNDAHPADGLTANAPNYHNITYDKKEIHPFVELPRLNKVSSLFMIDALPSRVYLYFAKLDVIHRLAVLEVVRSSRCTATVNIAAKWYTKFFTPLVSFTNILAVTETDISKLYGKILREVSLSMLH